MADVSAYLAVPGRDGDRHGVIGIGGLPVASQPNGVAAMPAWRGPHAALVPGAGFAVPSTLDARNAEDVCRAAGVAVLALVGLSGQARGMVDVVAISGCNPDRDVRGGIARSVMARGDWS